MKIVVLIVAAVVAALGAVAGTIWVGSRVREDTVVEHPYEQGLQHDAEERARRAGRAPSACDLGTGPCTLALPGLGDLTLALGPRPLRTMSALTVEATLRAAGAPAEASAMSLDLTMAGMDMGPNHASLQPAGPGAWKGSAVLVRCPSGRKEWDVAVTVERSGAPPVRGAFRAVVVE